MVVDLADLAALAADVDRFLIRDRRMRAAQATMRRAIADGRLPEARAIAAYLDAVRTYFGAFAGEAERRLRDVDDRLARVSQLQYNLTAERGVGARRVEAIGTVLDRAARLQSR